MYVYRALQINLIYMRMYIYMHVCRNIQRCVYKNGYKCVSMSEHLLKVPSSSEGSKSMKEEIEGMFQKPEQHLARTYFAQSEQGLHPLHLPLQPEEGCFSCFSIGWPFQLPSSILMHTTICIKLTIFLLKLALYFETGIH